MKEIEAEVLKKGFKLQEERKRVSIDFWKKFKLSTLPDDSMADHKNLTLVSS